MLKLASYSALSLVSVLGLMAAAPPVAAAPSPFDGRWSVMLSCPATTDGKAMAYAYQFAAQVKDGVLHGERGTAGAPGWLQFDGPIAADGSAELVAQGLTNIPSYALYNVSKGTPYKHAVKAQFQAGHGTGSWTTVRTCTFAFDRP
jgi:hypothetical protein